MTSESTSRRPPVEYRVRDHNATDEIVVDFRARFVFVPTTLVLTFQGSPGALRRAVYAAERQADPLGAGLSTDRGQVKLRDRAPDGEVFLADDGDATAEVPATVLEYVLGLSTRPAAPRPRHLFDHAQNPLASFADRAKRRQAAYRAAAWSR